jgi:hypothetical protein
MIITRAVEKIEGYLQATKKRVWEPWFPRVPRKAQGGSGNSIDAFKCQFGP